MNENTLMPEQPVSKPPLLDRYEKKYRDALSVIDNEVKDLIQNGKEMEGLFLFAKNLSAITEVHEALSRLYILVFNNQNILKVYGSKRLNQLYQRLKPIRELVVDFDGTQEKKEKFILADLREAGSFKTHPFLNTCMISEMEYMIKTLRILVEPDFDIKDTSEEEDEDEFEKN